MPRAPMPPYSPPTSKRPSNQLLAALPEQEWRRWLPQLERVLLTPGQVLYDPGSRPIHVYFPVTAVVGEMHGTADGASMETALVGNEGIVGSALFMGSRTMPSGAVVHSGGLAYRMAAHDLNDAFERSPSVMHLLLRYAQALITQTAQEAVCNRHHSLDQRLCKWLLLMLDRLGGSDLVTTQELIARNLGVRREGVTESAHKLQQLGLIRYARGHIQVLDRAGLERRACECYAVVAGEYARLLPHELAA